MKTNLEFGITFKFVCTSLGEMAGLGSTSAKHAYSKLIDFAEVGNIFTPIMASLQQQAEDMIAKMRGSMDIVQFNKYEKRYLHYKTKLLKLVVELESSVSASSDKKSKMTQRLDRVYFLLIRTSRNLK